MPSKPNFDPRIHMLSNGDASQQQQSPRSEGQQPSNTTGTTSDGGDKHQVDDEALARMLQQQILEEEHRSRQHQSRKHQQQQQPAQSPSGRNQEEQDLQLVMMMQRQEMAQGSGGGTTTNTSSNMDDLELARRMQREEMNDGVSSDAYQNQLDYARRVQRQAFEDVRRSGSATPLAGMPETHVDAQLARRIREIDATPPPGIVSPDADAELARRMQEIDVTPSSKLSAPDADAELARRMQQLEQMGMGRLNSNRRMDEEERVLMDGSTTNDKGGAPNSTIDTTPKAKDTSRSRQEEEDERLARMIAESGESLQYVPPQQPPIPLAAPPPVTQARSSPTPPTQTTPKSSRKQDSPPHGIDRIPADPFPVNASSDGPAGKDKKKRGFFNRKEKSIPRLNVPAAIPPPPVSSPAAPSPPAPVVRGTPVPYSTMGSQKLTVPLAPHAQMQKKKPLGLPSRSKQPVLCSSCKRPASSFLIALDKKYHAECFKCVGCHMVIDSAGAFAFMADEKGNKHPLHQKCYAELYGVKCAVCNSSIPAGPDGKVSFVKHPFFDAEQMCPRHASEQGRRCTGCHRFEPEGEPFADLNDAGRCACFSCCRSVVVDGQDARPLWNRVVNFFEHKLNLPIWRDMREVPILVVGYDALNDQLLASGNAHGGSSQIMTRGLCLTEHQSGRRFKLAKLKFNQNNHSFEACDVEEKGFTFFQVPDASKTNPDSCVTAILCLSGLPRDLTASVLAHEALHAWIKLHPRYDIRDPIPPQVEEGCAQLIAMLFLMEGLDEASVETYGDPGPSDEKLRQYFKFSIETDDHEIYGEGYRKAAHAYANIGIEALLSHVVLYKDFPRT